MAFSTKTSMPNIKKIKNTELEIYFKYNRLDTKDLIEILDNINRLYETILSCSAPVYVYNDIPLRNFMEIDSIHTGESIKFKLKEGWKPEFDIKDGDFNIQIPKMLGVPAIVIYFLLGGINNAMGINIKYQQTKLNDMELKIKQLDLDKKIRDSSSEKKRKINFQTRKTIHSIINNKEIHYFEINGFHFSLDR